VSESDTEKVIFMVVEYFYEEGSKEECEKTKFDYIEELLSAIEFIKWKKKKNKTLQKELKRKEETQIPTPRN
jgi:hypothetical protein